MQNSLSFHSDAGTKQTGRKKLAKKQNLPPKIWRWVRLPLSLQLLYLSNSGASNGIFHQKFSSL